MYVTALASFRHKKMYEKIHSMRILCTKSEKSTYLLSLYKYTVLVWEGVEWIQKQEIT